MNRPTFQKKKQGRQILPPNSEGRARNCSSSPLAKISKSRWASPPRTTPTPCRRVSMAARLACSARVAGGGHSCPARARRLRRRSAPLLLVVRSRPSMAKIGLPRQRKGGDPTPRPASTARRETPRPHPPAPRMVQPGHHGNRKAPFGRCLAYLYQRHL